jgi:hypothetical protein
MLVESQRHVPCSKNVLFTSEQNVCIYHNFQTFLSEIRVVERQKFGLTFKCFGHVVSSSISFANTHLRQRFGCQISIHYACYKLEQATKEFHPQGRFITPFTAVAKYGSTRAKNTNLFFCGCEIRE